MSALMLVIFMVGLGYVAKGATCSEYWPVGRNEAVRRMLAKDRSPMDPDEPEMERGRR